MKIHDAEKKTFVKSSSLRNMVTRSIRYVRISGVETLLRVCICLVAWREAGNLAVGEKIEDCQK